MLNRVNFSLTTAQISDFILEKEYTNFLTLQQVFSELTEAGMISSQSIRNRTHLSITEEGKETLSFFKNRIGYFWHINTCIKIIIITLICIFPVSSFYSDGNGFHRCTWLLYNRTTRHAHYKCK